MPLHGRACKLALVVSAFVVGCRMMRRQSALSVPRWIPVTAAVRQRHRRRCGERVACVGGQRVRQCPGNRRPRPSTRCVQLVALVAAQVSFEVPPDVTDVGDADRSGRGLAARDGDGPRCGLRTAGSRARQLVGRRRGTRARALAAAQAFVPLQPPAAVQLVEFVEVHDNFDEPPDATLVGAAVSVTDGQGTTVPPIFLTTLPPSPVQVSRNVTYSWRVNGPTLAVPDVGFAPLHARGRGARLCVGRRPFQRKHAVYGLALVKRERWCSGSKCVTRQAS